MDKFVGKRLDGRYEIQEIIGVGGMAVVYKARDNVEDKIVAVKILKDEFTSNEEFIRRFKNESKAIAMLSHPNIVKVNDVSFGDLIQYIVMEYIDGITLKEFIERQGSLRWKDAVHFTIQILKALQHAHDKGIVHRDVKPQNIMVLSDGTIKVTDFGIARFARSEQRTITDKAIGSVHYISPEQARGERTDEKADIYSVGVILYEMLTGQVPFQAESAVSVAIMQLQREPGLPSEINSSIPKGLEQITLHAMQKVLERRYQSASEMLCDLDEFRKDPEKTFEYSYFVDDSPTKYVDDELRSSTPASQTPIVEELEEAEDVKERNNIIPILAGIAATLVVTLIVLAAIFIPKLLSGTPSEMECPKFIGMTLEQVQEQYNDIYDFEIKQGHDDEIEDGCVYQQSIPEGKKVKKGAKITLHVSMGQELVKVPDLTDAVELNAKQSLEEAGFKVEIIEIADDDIEAGRVVKTDPAKTTTVAKGTTVKLYISTGKSIEDVTVPNAVSKKSASAKALLEEEGLLVEVKEVDMTPEDKYYPKGYVYRQEPAAGEKLPEGSKVTIYVSTDITAYEFDLKVTKHIPVDFVNKTPEVALYDDSGKQVATTSRIDIEKATSITFKGVSIKREGEPLSSLKMNGYIMFSDSGNQFHEVIKLTIDLKTGDVLSTSAVEGYPTDAMGSAGENENTAN